MSQWQPADPRRRPPVTPPQFERRNEPLHAPAHVQRQYPQEFQPAAPPRQFPAAPPRRTRSGRPPYPAHLVRFPDGALPGSSRRRRGVSGRRIFFLGRHPVLLLIELWIVAAAIGFVCAWIALVVTVWALWTAAVTAAWLCRVAAAAVRG